jgi:signal transduction histidine kinase
MTWFGACDLHPEEPHRAASPVGQISGGCYPDAQGRLWWADIGRGFRVREGSRERFFERVGLHRIAGSFPRRDGSAWLATEDGPFLARRDGGRPAACGSAPPPAWGGSWGESWLSGIVEDGAGRLWIARGNEVAGADADSVARGAHVVWRVETLPGVEHIGALRLIAGDDLWAATSIAGVWRRHDGRWSDEPGNATLPSLRVYNLEPARAGGWWLLADGWIGRVEPRPAARGGGWDVRETLTAWQGLPSLQASDLLEDPDGRLWIASLLGLVEMPATTRNAPRAVPRVELVEARAGGKAMALGGPLVLPYHRNDLELRFTALSFRDPSHLRYQVRLLPGGSWMESREPVFHAVDLSSGSHALEVRASLDGQHWSAAPARLAFGVSRPWYLEPWALLAFALWAAALAWAAHRVRVAMLLRLERQRMRIAMDLHDEMGSGLGSIGILAGLAADGPLEDSARRRLAGEIASLSSDLGATLSEIVRSLREGPDTLDRWASQLVERAQRLVPGPCPQLHVVMPEAVPSIALAPEVRRELMLAAVEALHNAARHAHAGTITLGLEPGGAAWRLWVEDDGCGLPADAFARPGSFGLGNMRRRLRAVHGEAEWCTRPGGGTCVELRFIPEPGRRGAGPLARMFVRNREGAQRERIDA